jgi:hypothetical protein
MSSGSIDLYRQQGTAMITYAADLAPAEGC